MGTPPAYGATHNVEAGESAMLIRDQEDDSTIVIRFNGDEGHEGACVCNCCCCGCTLGNPLSVWLCGFGISIGQPCGVTLCCVPILC